MHATSYTKSVTNLMSLLFYDLYDCAKIVALFFHLTRYRIYKTNEKKNVSREFFQLLTENKVESDTATNAAN